MSKKYNWRLYASPAEKRGEIIFKGFGSLIHSSEFVGTFDELADYVQTLKSKLAAENQFESGKGFSVSFALTGNQRKPAGFDAKRLTIPVTYIAP